MDVDRGGRSLDRPHRVDRTEFRPLVVGSTVSPYDRGTPVLVGVFRAEFVSSALVSGSNL